MHLKHLLDTSALVKLILYPDIKEEGSEALYEFRENHSGFYTFDLCVGEALNVLKQKAFSKGARKVLSMPDGYLICVNRLICYTKPQHTIRLIRTELSHLGIEEMGMVKKYEVDFVDAFVIEKARSMRGCLLITADSGMEKAASDMGLKVWNCTR